jgi:predicted AAA+ superfamily ATPase
MQRYLLQAIKADLHKKIILLTGPRQTGKTTLAKMVANDYEYYNYDRSEDRLAVHKKSWDRDKSLLILDELHKMPKWKAWLKGIYDTEGAAMPMLVTGSAKLDTYKKVGDSLAGRFFQFRLHPFDVKEVCALLPSSSPEAALGQLLEYGGFPEPFLEASTRFYKRWRRSHLDIILKQDLIELESVTAISRIELLIELLRERVGSPISYSSLAQDLEVSDKTVKHWLVLLENMYVIFKVSPYHRNIARAVLKQPKYYFYDVAQVNGDNGVRL